MIGRGRDLSLPRDEIHVPVRGSRILRLDQYLKDVLAWRSRTRIQQLIRSGRVSVNERATKPSLLVRPGDQVVVRLSSGVGMPDYSARKLEILYEDPWLVAVNKPPHLLVHPVGRHVYDTLMNYLHFQYRDIMQTTGDVHLRLCHRIDKDTTGVLVVGKDRYVHQSVGRQFESRKVSKRYLLLVRGHFPHESDVIDRPLAEGRDLESCLGGPTLKPSRTRIWTLRRLSIDGQPYTWMRAHPLSGRQNQIRLHLAAIGYPLAGDERFGDGPSAKGLPDRFILHSRELSFYQPRLKSQIRLEAPLPDDVVEMLERARDV